MRRTEGQLDEFIGRGMAVLDNLVEQKGFLKVFTPCIREMFGAGVGNWLCCGDDGCFLFVF